MVTVNKNYLKLPGSYLFSTIAKKVAKYTEEHPDKKIIKLGIGDVTKPIVPVCIEAMKKAVEEMGTAQGFRGYGPEQGYEFSCTVTNTGKIPGKEVVQLYIAAPGKTMVKPQKELKAFAKTKILAPGESEVVRLVVGLSELASFDEQASCWAVESGRYLAIWGSSSRDCRLKQSFTLRQAVTGEEVHRVLLPVRQLEELY